MDKTFLESRIEERANERFNEEFQKLVNFIHNHPIGGKLKITLGDEKVPMANFGVNYGLLNKEQLKNRQTENTNLAEVKDQMLKEYKEEETDNLLNKLENIGYLFDQ